MRTFTAVFGLALVIASVGLFPLACGGEDTDTVQLPDGGSVTLSITPASATRRVGETQAFVAIATSNDGRDADVGEFVNWSSSDPAIATIDPQTGLATAVAVGRATITARRENIVATAELSVAVAGDSGLTDGDAAQPSGDTWLFVSNLGGEGIKPSIRVYDPNATGDTAPLRIIEGPATKLLQPSEMAINGNELIVADGEAKAILVFDVTASGDTAPKRFIQGFNTTFTPFSTTGVAVRGNELFVADQGRGLLVFPLTGSGDIAPTRTVASFIYGKWVTNSTVTNEVFVAVSFPSEARGFVAADGEPTRSLSPGKNGARGMTTTPTEIFVTTTGGQVGATPNDTVTVFAHDAPTGAAPLRTIAGGATGLDDPHGIGVRGGEIYVTSQGVHAVRIFDETANGDVAPKRSIVGPATGLRFPSGLLLTPSR